MSAGITVRQTQIFSSGIDAQLSLLPPGKSCQVSKESLCDYFSASFVFGMSVPRRICHASSFSPGLVDRGSARTNMPQL